MTLNALLVAAGLAAATAAVAPASAQTMTTTRTTTVHSERGMRAPVVVVRDHRARRQVCRTTWRHHRKVRRCYRR